jgi:predicted patatin/cPLA2 family phospholipase
MHHIVFSGGGADGIAYTGVIQALEEANLYSEIHHAAGTSIGALYAFLVACQVSSLKLKPVIYDYCKYIETLEWKTSSVFNIVHRLSIDSGHILINLLDRVFELTQFSKDITFIQFSKSTGRTCSFCAVCLEKAYPTYFTLDTTPDVKIYDALYASMAIPMIFPPKQLNGLSYVDGGTIDNFPLDIFLQKAYHKEQVNIQNIYGIYIYRTIETVQNPCANMLSLGSALLRCIFSKTLFFIEHYVKLLPKFTLLEGLPFNVLPYQTSQQGFRLILTDEKITYCIQTGYTLMRKKLESLQTLT